MAVEALVGTGSRREDHHVLAGAASGHPNELLVHLQRDQVPRGKRQRVQVLDVPRPGKDADGPVVAIGQTVDSGDAGPAPQALTDHRVVDVRVAHHALGVGRGVRAAHHDGHAGEGALGDGRHPVHAVRLVRQRADSDQVGLIGLDALREAVVGDALGRHVDDANVDVPAAAQERRQVHAPQRRHERRRFLVAPRLDQQDPKRFAHRTRLTFRRHDVSTPWRFDVAFPQTFNLRRLTRIVIRYGTCDLSG
jgi:hypothetical protein